MHPEPDTSTSQLADRWALTHWNMCTNFPFENVSKVGLARLVPIQKQGNQQTNNNDSYQKTKGRVTVKFTVTFFSTPIHNIVINLLLQVSTFRHFKLSELLRRSNAICEWSYRQYHFRYFMIFPFFRQALSLITPHWWKREQITITTDHERGKTKSQNALQYMRAFYRKGQALTIAHINTCWHT